MSKLYEIPEQLHHSWGGLRAKYRSYGDFILNAPVFLHYAPCPGGTAEATETSITFDPSFCATLDLDTMIGLFLHEEFHIILDDIRTMKRWTAQAGVHCPAIRDKSGTVIIPARILPVKGKVANIGMDCRINDAVTRILGAKLPSGACYHPLITFNATAEETYTIVWEEEEGGGTSAGKSTQNNLSGAGGGYQPGDGKTPSKGGSDVSEDGAASSGSGSPSPLHQDPSRMRQMARQAVEDSDTTKSKGIGPGDLARLANMVHPKKIAWAEEITRDVRATFGHDETDWSRPMKSMFGLGRYWPGKRGNRLGTFVAECDTSGSMTKMELGLIIGVLEDVVSDVLPERLIMLDVDDRVQRVREFDDPTDFIQALKSLPCRDDRETGFKGGGGTDMGHAFKWCLDNNVEPDLLMIITDAGTAWPSSIDPALQCIVACTDPRPEIMDSIPAHMGKRFAIEPL